MIRVVTALGAAGLMSACGGTSVSARGPFGASPPGSEVTDISIGLPDRGPLKDQVADIETKMNAYRLVVAAADSTCAGATALDQIGVYATNAKIAAKLVQGCDYDLTLELGQERVAEPDPVPAVAYESGVKALLERACVSCHAATAAYGSLVTYADAKAKGAAIVARAVTGGDMPPAGALPTADRDLLKAWADGGYLEKAPADPALSGDPKTLAAVYYRNAQAKRIAKDEIQGKAEYRAAVVLDLTDAGRELGLGAD